MGSVCGASGVVVLVPPAGDDELDGNRTPLVEWGDHPAPEPGTVALVCNWLQGSGAAAESWTPAHTPNAADPVNADANPAGPGDEFGAHGYA